MNEHQKKSIYMKGTLLNPIFIGGYAYISRQGQVIRTSRIVAITEQSHYQTCFETKNTHYCIARAPVPMMALQQAYSLCA